MPFVFAIIGVTLVVAGVRGKTADLFALLKQDFTGTPNFVSWMIAIFIIGAVGYIKQLAPISRMFMALIVIDLLFTNRGFFSAFTQQTTSQPSTAPNTTTQRISLPALPTLPTIQPLTEV